jgi:hypothetical protein
VAELAAALGVKFIAGGEIRDAAGYLL